MYEKPIPNDSHSSFHRKVYIRLLVWCHLWPIWPPVLPLNLFLAYFSYSGNIYIYICRLMWSPCCLWVPTYKLLNAWTSLYETGYVYQGTWAHLNGLLHPPISLCFCMCIPPVVARQGLGKIVSAAANTRGTIEELLSMSFSMRSVLYQREVDN
jgi:hypothetical protein